MKERISNFQIQNISIWCKRKHSTFIHSFLEKVSCSLNKYVKWKLFAFCLLTRICIEFSNRGKVFFYLKAFSYPGNTFCNSDYLNNTCYRNGVASFILVRFMFPIKWYFLFRIFHSKLLNYIQISCESKRSMWLTFCIKDTDLANFF